MKLRKLRKGEGVKIEQNETKKVRRCQEKLSQKFEQFL
jgi:hypothetical protein